MFTPSSPDLIRITAVSVSLTGKAKPVKRLVSGTLQIGPRKYKLIRDHETLSQELGNNIEISPDVRILLSYKRKWSLGKTLEIDPRHFFESPVGGQQPELSVSQGDICVVFERPPAEMPSRAPLDDRISFPTAIANLDGCPRFHILVIGNAGVGKSTLINIAFGVEEAFSADPEHGKANIQDGLESRANKQFIFHDSLGFEPGTKDNYEIVKQFIQDRQTDPLKDQLHAVWFCIRAAPQAWEQLLEDDAKDFFISTKRMMGPTPFIVVFTKFDTLVDEQKIQLMVSNHGSIDDESIAARALSKAESIVRAGYDKITQLTGESLLYTVVSTRNDYRHTLQKLVDETYRQVGTCGSVGNDRILDQAQEESGSGRRGVLHEGRQTESAETNSGSAGGQSLKSALSPHM